jgi:hypothetical protein
LSESFTLFGQQWQVWVVQGLIYMALAIAPAVVGYVMFYVAFFAGAMASGAAGDSPGAAAGAIGGMTVGFALLAVGGLVSTFFSIFLMAGMKHTAAKQLRGEPIAAGDIFAARDVFWPFLGAYILYSLIVGAGTLFCIVPGFVLAGMLSLTFPIVLEQRTGVIEALQRSWEVTKPNMWMWTLWFLLLYLIIGVGGSTCVGYVAVLPIFCIALMIAYRDAIGLPGALPAAGAIPVVPPQQFAQYGPAGPPVAAGTCPACGRAVAAGAVQCPFCQAALPGPQGP